MFVSDITRKVQRLFGESSDFIVFNQQDIYDWINEAQMRIVRDTHCLTGTNTTAASTYPKALPADWIVSKRVTYANNVLKLMAIEDLDQLNINPSDPIDSPSFYYIFAGQLRLYPTLGAADTANNVTHDYVKTATTITAVGNTPDVPISFHEDIVRYCVMRAHERNENFRAMESSSAIFESALGLRLEEASKQEDDFYVVRDDPAEDTYGFNIW